MAKHLHDVTGRDMLRPQWNEIDFDLSDQARKVPVPPQQAEAAAGGTVIDLPARESWKIPAVTVEQAIAHRESRRKFSAAPLGLDELAFLLWATQGVRAPGPVRSRRTVPSAGCRHACETWLYIDRVEGLEPGLYRYLPLGHQLVLQRSWQEDMPVELDKALLEQYWQAPAYFIWTAVPYRMEWRYTTASAKLIAIDVGHVCQNLYLACESIGCGTCGIGAYDQTAMDAFLGVDGEEEFALYMAPVGKLA